MNFAGYRKSGHLWFAGRPDESINAIVTRAAIRAVPALGTAPDDWLQTYALAPIRSAAIAWAALNYPAHSMFDASGRAYEAAWRAAHTHKFEVDAEDAPSFVAATFACAHASDLLYAPRDSILSSIEQALGFAMIKDDPVNEFRFGVEADVEWLDFQDDEISAARIFTRRSLWLGFRPKSWNNQWQILRFRLLQIDPTYAVWIDWYERRIRGERAAFDLPGDKYRKEDKAILRRLAQATDADFWGKGATYVNTTLQSWIDEARARVAPPPEIDSEIDVPKQEAEAIAYGVNADGKLDRLPHADQMHLRDLPDQRRSYADIRDAALELIEEGQRLGPRLGAALNRFIQSLPDRFEDAEAYLVWRDGNALRRLHRAHRLVADGQEPDPARLEAAVAEGLGGLLDLYNNFAFADDGLRAKDEARVSPQERTDAEEEARAASPLIKAILARPEIATTEALDDIAADVDATDLPIDDPYSGQAIAQANRTKRNWVAGLLEGARKALRNPKLVGYRLGKGVTEGAGKAIGYAAVGGAIGSTYLFHAPILEFIATHAALLEDYVAIAYSGYPHLGDLIRRAKALWECWRS